MHLLTKLFIVLVSLLAVLLVPLVVVYAYNEDSFKAKYEQSDLQAKAANSRLQEQEVSFGARQAALQRDLDRRTAENEQLAAARDQALADLRQSQRDLAAIESQQGQVVADIATLSSALSVSQQILGNLLGEVQAARAQSLDSERRVVELDERLRELSAQLDVATAARRALAEELQQIRDELARAQEVNQRYAARHGPLEGETAATPPVPDRDLDAKVLNVQRGDQTLAEIDAGARDGIRKGWIMAIGRENRFIANLRIIEVDINRATGVVELEEPDLRGSVQPGDRVMARAGQT